MSALTDNLNTPKIAGEDPMAALTIYDAEILYAGGIVAIDYADEIQMASDTQGLRVIGIAPKKVDNTDDGETLEPTGGSMRGIYRFTNSSAYVIPRSAIGEVAYVEDDQTVGSWSTNLVPAGLVHDVDSDGVWVDMRPWALAYARSLVPPTVVSKTDDYTATAAICFDGRTILSCNKSGGMEVTLPSAVGGYRIGVKRAAAFAFDDLTVQAATGDRIEASDGFCAAGKQIDNTVDAISEVLWLRAVDDTYWVIDNPYPGDVASWVKNDA